MELLKEYPMATYIKSKYKGVFMSRVNKTKNRLMEVWNDLDEAYGRMERSLEKLSSMSNLPDEFEREINNFDISAISSLKQHVEFLLDEVAMNV